MQISTSQDLPWVGEEHKTDIWLPRLLWGEGEAS